MNTANAQLRRRLNGDFAGRRHYDSGDRLSDDSAKPLQLGNNYEA